MANVTRIKPLGEYIEITRRFQRAVNVEDDVGTVDTLRGYIVTPAVRRMFNQITNVFAAGEGDCAWNLIGPYGTGKSAFAVFLSQILAPPRSGFQAAPGLRQELLKKILGADKLKIRLWPVVVTAERAPLGALVLRGLKKTLERRYKGRPGRKPALLKQVGDYVEGSEYGTSDVVRCFQEAGRLIAADHRKHGLLLVIDETGKALEFAVQHPQHDDLFLLQQLAEAAADARKQDGPPFIVLTILHQSFEQYARQLDSSAQAEWKKIKGRFAELLAQESGDHVVRLTAEAITATHPRPPALIKKWTEACSCVAKWVHTSSGWDERPLRKILDKCWPIHPVTATLLGPLFRGPLSQNERSLFAFLGAGEPHSFREFVRKGRVNDRYTVDQLYDYVVTVLGSGLFRRHQVQGWSEIATALQRLGPAAEHLDAQLIKTIGLVNMLGPSAGLRPSEALLATCADDERKTQASLKRLAKQGLVVYRDYRDAFQLYEGSDIDLEDLASKARQQLSDHLSVAETLTQAVPQVPMVARRHLCETGTLRYFSVHFVPADRVCTGDYPKLDPLADGGLFFAVASTDSKANALHEYAERDVKQLKKSLADFGTKPVMLVVPKNRGRLAELAMDLKAWQSVSTTTPALQADRVARRELSGRIDDVQLRLEQETAHLFDPHQSHWYDANGHQQLDSTRLVNRYLSTLCAKAYPAAPIIRNELLNRQKLSSTAALARRKLLAAMIEAPHEERLGIQKAPPELSMYLSLLQESGFHQKLKSNQEWGFGAPKELQSLCDTLDQFLQNAEQEQCKISELYDRLRQPPFGLKDGPLPLITMALLLWKWDDVAFYKHGTFVEDWRSVENEVFLKKPEEFSVKHYPMTPFRKKVLARLGSLPDIDLNGEVPTVIKIVKKLYKQYHSLPPFTKSTSTLSERATKVRNHLADAREPEKLLFEQLPEACGINPISSSTQLDDRQIKEFATTLQKTVKELLAAYAELLKRSKQKLIDLLNLPTDQFEATLKARASQIQQAKLDRGHERFTNFLNRVTQEFEDDKWLESVLAGLAETPAGQWTSRDEDRFLNRLEEVAKEFRTVYPLVVERRNGTGKETGLVSVSIAGISTKSQHYVFDRKTKDQDIEQLRKSIQNAVGTNGTSDSRDRIATALAWELDALLTKGKNPERQTP